MARPLEPAVRVVTLATELLTITAGVVSSETKLPTLVDKTTSLVIEPSAPIAMRCLFPPNR